MKNPIPRGGAVVNKYRGTIDDVLDDVRAAHNEYYLSQGGADVVDGRHFQEFAELVERYASSVGIHVRNADLVTARSALLSAAATAVIGLASLDRKYPTVRAHTELSDDETTRRLQAVGSAIEAWHLHGDTEPYALIERLRRIVND